MTPKNRVFVTASASVTCAGENNTTLFQNILERKSGIKQTLDYFADATPAIGKLHTKHTFNNALMMQCKRVLEESRLDDFKETLLIIGSSVGGMATTEQIYFKDNNYRRIDPNQHHIHAISNLLYTAFDFYDDVSFSTACTSSANAIGYGYEVLSKGLYKNVLVVGVDSLSQTTVGGFLSLGVLSSSVCTPFDVQREGMNVSEAIACLLLETEPSKDAVEVCGVGYSSDAFHMTHPKPEGEGAISAMSQALKVAGIDAKEIDYVNAHGTGTIANDSAEAKALMALFPHSPTISSTKSITGHTLGAAGALEALISCFAIQQQIIPPNAGLEEPEEPTLNFPISPKKARLNYVMSNSFAFGGNNCSLIFGKYNEN